MTPEEFKEEMLSILEANLDDYEASHRAMDRLMCRALTELGYREGVAIFQMIPKWYA